MAEFPGPPTPRLLALLAEAERHAALLADAHAAFMLGAAAGLLLGVSEPGWARAALDEHAAALSAADGQDPAAHRAELRALVRRVLVAARHEMDEDERSA